MDSSIVATIISSIFTVICLLITNASNNRRIMTQLKENQTIMQIKYDERMKNMEEKASKIPKIESDLHELDTRVARHDEKLKLIGNARGGNA
jgi:hypothetical protein